MLKINNEKAIDIAKNQIRSWREAEFTKNDIALQNALADNDDAARVQAIERRNYLRDLPLLCEGKSVDELKHIMSTLGIIKEVV